MARCYCTLVTSESYVPGAIVLSHSLRKLGSNFSLAVLVTEDDQTPSGADRLKESLKKHFDHIIPIDRIIASDATNLAMMNRPELTSTFSKIRLWQQVQYEKIVYLDADTFCLCCPDKLFDVDADFAAAPDHGFPDYFNSGVMVLKPNLQTFDALHALAAKGSSFDGGDQGLLNQYYKNFHRLSFVFNLQLYKYYRLNMPAVTRLREKLAIVHFLGSEKPWHLSEDDPLVDDSKYSEFFAEVLKLWWSLYHEAR